MADKLAVSADVAFYLKHIEAYEKAAASWQSRSRKIIARYKDTQEDDNLRTVAQFNILWSNVQTLAPALYANPPKPNIDTRQQDDDEVGRVAAQVMERATSYYVGEELFNQLMKQIVLDRLLCGRGTPWVRYVPNIKDEVQVSEDQVASQVDTKEPETKPVLYGEDVVGDYVHWEDFGHAIARTWQEVPIVWRKAWLSRPKAEARFGKDKLKDVSFAEKKEGEKDQVGVTMKACFYEIWDKNELKAVWLNKDAKKLLDEKPDPLGLRDFFPCPQPLYATISNDGLIPTPDYILYQDQAEELDKLTGRIRIITSAVKVGGVYDSTAEGVQRLLNENVDNKLIAVENWAVFGDKGGLKGVMDLLPLVDILNTLLGLYQARDKVKQDLYEITGISDIIRGESDPNETATAQNIKGKFATIRLDAQQKEVARIARDMVRMYAEIIAEHFDMDTIKAVSGVKLLTEQEKQHIQAQQQQAQQMAQQAQAMGQQVPPPPPLPPEMQKLMEQPTWEQVEKLLRDDMIRSFRVDIETDSTIKLDQDAERDSRVQFIQAAGGFIQNLAQTPPQFLPLGAEMLLFAVRGFKIGRDMESTFKLQLDKIKEQAENPPQQADPEAAKLQAQAEQEKNQMMADVEKDRTKVQADVENNRIEKDAEVQKNAQDAQWKTLAEENKAEELRIKGKELFVREKEIDLKERQMEFDDMQAQRDHALAALEAITKESQAARDHEQTLVEMQTPPEPEKDNDKTDAVAAAIEKLAESQKGPRKFKLIRGGNGELQGAEEV